MSPATTDLEAADVERHAAVVRQALEEVEEAISRHPEGVAELYRTGREAYLAGADRAGGCDPSTSAVLRYLLAMAFISAWYHVQGNRQNRDQAARSAALVAGPIIDPEQSFQQLLEFEQLWRRSFRMKGISRSTSARELLLKLLVLAAVVIFVVKALSG